MPRLTIQNMMIAVAVLALVMADAKLSVVLLLLAGSAVVLLPRNRGRWALPFFAALACLYLPYLWLVLIDYPWNHYRWQWFQRWPIAPGLPAGLFFHGHEPVEAFISGMMTLGLVVLLTRLGARGRKTWLAANGTALILAGMESFVGYQLFWF